MKRTIFIVLFLTVLVLANTIYSWNIDVHTTFLDVSESGVAHSEMANRRYFLVINTSTSSLVYMSEDSISSTTYRSVGAISLNVNRGHWEDNYGVYQSTWYFCTTTGTATIEIMEKD
jgi:hypothetical protein